MGQRLRDVIGLEIGDGTEQVSPLVIARALLGPDRHTPLSLPIRHRHPPD